MFDIFNLRSYFFKKRRQIANCSIVFITFLKKMICFKITLNSQKFSASCDIRFFDENFQSSITRVDDEYKLQNIFNCCLIMLTINQQFKNFLNVKDVKIRIKLRLFNVTNNLLISRKSIKFFKIIECCVDFESKSTTNKIYRRASNFSIYN